MKKIQSGYNVQTLSAFLGTARPTGTSGDRLAEDRQEPRRNEPVCIPERVLQFCPTMGTAEVEKPLRQRFARIGIEPGELVHHGSSDPGPEGRTGGGDEERP